ncbi:MAG: phosphopyruvate hydratase [Patescibacteria group bacterium]|jgi:enolase
MSRIKKIVAREILDSRGNPTVETEVVLDNGVTAKSSVPSGASVGKYEAFELRDNDRKRYGGMGVLKAIENVNDIIGPELIGMDAGVQEIIDKRMIDLDGTENKCRLGANAILSVSLAVCRAGAKSKGLPLFQYIQKHFNFSRPKLPIPCFNIFNGGRHADTNLDFQEFLVIPGQTKKSFREMVRMGAEIFHMLGKVLREAGFDTDVGAEGGYAPDMHSSIQAIELILAAGVRAGYNPGKDFGLGIDVGSSAIYNKKTGKYIFKLDQSNFTGATLTGLYYEWFRKYPLVYLEDGLSEDDFSGWKELNRELGREMMVVGDDLFATSIHRLRQGLKEKAANAIIIKPNQAGTLTETIDCIKLAQSHALKIIISHRSGETTDDFISDLAAAAGADYIKAGSLSRGERVAKYNRLMEIENKL